MKVSLAQLIAGIFALVTATAGATFTITKYAHESKNEAYRIEIDGLNKHIKKLENRLIELQSISPAKPGSADSDELSVRILSPLKSVTQYADVRFVVQGDLPDGHKPLLAVLDPLGNWWSWGTSESSTYNRIQFGNVSDRGKQFEIRVIITDAEFPPDQPRRTLPDYLASGSVIVKRD